MANWPWILSPVQGWFESFWDSINSWITQGLASLWRSVSAAFDTVATWITTGLDGLWTSISASFDSVSRWITEGFSAAWGRISAAFDMVSTWITEAVDGLWISVSGAFDSVSTWISDAVTSLVDTVSAFFDSLWTSISKAFTSLADSLSTFFSDLWTKTSAAITAVTTSLGESLTLAVGTISGYVQDALQGVAQAMGGALQGFLSWIWTQLQAIASAIAGAASAVRDAVAPVFTPVLTGLMTSATEMLTPGSPPEEIKKAADDLAKQWLKRIQELIPKTSKSVPSLASLLTASAGIYGAGLLTAFGLTSVGTYLDMVHPAKMTGIMTMTEQLLYSLNIPSILGPIVFSNVYAGIIVSLRYRWNELYTPIIPPAPDLITMVVREAFVEAMVIPAPGVFAEHMAYHGFAKEWADRYWTMHFVPIALRQAYDNLWRGRWEKDDFMRALHIADIHPMWREDIYAVAFRAPSVREMGYGYDVGEYSVEDIVKYRRWGGLSPEDAEKAGRSMVAYRTEAEREALRREAMADFVAGLDGEAQLRANLAAIGGRLEIVDLWVARAQFRARRDLTLDLVKVVTTDFVKGWSTEDEFRSDLIELGVVLERREVLIRQAKARRLKYRREETVEKKKLLSISKIEKARELGLIGDEVFVRRAMDAGYTEDDARLMLAIEITPRPVTPEELARRRRTVTSKLNRAMRRWERSMARVETSITLLEGQIGDAEVTMKESLDVIDAQIANADEDVASYLDDIEDLESMRGEEMAKARAELTGAELAAELAEIESRYKTKIAKVVKKIDGRRGRIRVLVQRREALEARWTARILSLTRRKTETVEEKDLMERLGDEELGEYEAELKLLEVA